MMVHMSLRERFAHRKVEIEDRLREEAPKAKASLARLWRRDAAAIRKASVQAERRAEKALAHGWELAKPKVHHAKVQLVAVEHKVARGIWARIHARAALGMRQ